MRLLNVKTRKLEEYFRDIPVYAILSHTWGKEEVTLQDLDHPDHKIKQGYAKIHGFCSLAEEDGYEYVWIDTCCIDKTSSAELSEAINSMFRWYADAAVCYAYLEDVHPGDDPRMMGSQFRRSRWFTRGWTLQELLAPKRVDFYNSTWSRCGDRACLADAIEAITHISVPYLCKEKDIRTANLATRMTWAAHRHTTRTEDQAYALLGIFDVNMPLLYGEGDKAFERLQEELIRSTTDESILAWSPSPGGLLTVEANMLRPEPFPLDVIPVIRFALVNKGMLDLPEDRPPPRLLARSPDDFACWIDSPAIPIDGPRHTMEITNRGLRITIHIIRIELTHYGILDCQIGMDIEKILAIPLLKLPYGDDEFARITCAPCVLKLSSGAVAQMVNRTVYIKKYIHADILERLLWNMPYSCGLVRLQTSSDLHLAEVVPGKAYSKQWDSIRPFWNSQTKWQRTLLHYTDTTDVISVNDFVVILEPRSFFDTLFSFHRTPPPFICRIVRRSESQPLTDMIANFDLSNASNQLRVEGGYRVADVRRDVFLGREVFTVDITFRPSLSPLGFLDAVFKVRQDRLLNILLQSCTYICEAWRHCWVQYCSLLWDTIVLGEVQALIEYIYFTLYDDIKFLRSVSFAECYNLLTEHYTIHTSLTNVLFPASLLLLLFSIRFKAILTQMVVPTAELDAHHWWKKLICKNFVMLPHMPYMFQICQLLSTLAKIGFQCFVSRLRPGPRILELVETWSWLGEKLWLFVLVDAHYDLLLGSGKAGDQGAFSRRIFFLNSVCAVFLLCGEFYIWLWPAFSNLISSWA